MATQLWWEPFSVVDKTTHQNVSLSLTYCSRYPARQGRRMGEQMKNISSFPLHSMMGVSKAPVGLVWYFYRI